METQQNEVIKSRLLQYMMAIFYIPLVCISRKKIEKRVTKRSRRLIYYKDDQQKLATAIIS
jgi:hypothetical protein